MKYGHFSSEGLPLGFYDDTIHVQMPNGVIKLTDAQWQEFIDNNGLRKWHGGEVQACTPPETLAPIPQAISRFQARAALLAADLLSDVEAAVAAADPFSQLAWAEAQEWRRDSPTLDALAKGIGLTDAEIDDLFIQATAITA